MDDHNPIQNNQTEPTTTDPDMHMEPAANVSEVPTEPDTSISEPTTTEPAANVSEVPTEPDTSASEPTTMEPDMHTEPAANVSEAPTESTITQTPPLRSAFSMDASTQRIGDSTQTNDATYTMRTDSYSSNYYSSTPEPPSNGYGIASLVLGILSIPGGCCCGIGVLFGILGIVFGCVQQRDTFGKRPGIAIAGIVLSVIGIILSICCIIYLYVIGMAGTSYPSYLF